MPPVHHAAICTADIERARRFWRDGMGLTEIFDASFTGDWPTLFGAATDRLRSVFLGDPSHPDSGIVELVEMEGMLAPHELGARPRVGFFLLSFTVDVEATLERLAAAGFTEGIRRISVPAGGERAVAMAVLPAPDGVLVELVGSPA